MLKIRGQLHFSQLITLTISFAYGTKALVKVQQRGNDEDPYENTPVCINLIQAILDGTSKLSCLQLVSTQDCSFPTDFGMLRLPDSLETTIFDCNLQEEHAQLFQTNNLPNLTAMKFKLRREPTDMISTIISHTCSRLKHLEIAGIKCNGTVLQPNVIELPTMPSLESVDIYSSDVILNTNGRHLRNIFPWLHFLRLNYQRPLFLEDWLEDECYPKISSLSLSLVDPSLPQYHKSFTISPGSDVLRRIHRACPNIRELSITVNFVDLSCFGYIFQFMRSLKKLRVKFVGEEPTSGSDLVDSLLLGVPIQLAATIRKCGNYIQHVQLSDEALSLRQLTGKHF